MSSSRQRKSKKMRLMSSMKSELPLEILEVIFSKLPIAQFPLCRLVCKAWNSLILNLPSPSPNSLISNTFLVCSDFCEFPYIRNHVALYSVEYTPLGMINFSASFRLRSYWSNASIVGSCNGLLCITKQINSVTNCAAILNLMTNEYFKLPKWRGLRSEPTPTPYDCSNYVYFYGFGFSPNTKQYKLARITQAQTTLGILTSSLDVFTFGKAAKWTHIGSVPFTIRSHAVYSNGALFWTGFDHESENVIVCRMNFEDNIFEQVCSPKTDMNIGLFNDGLYATYCLDNMLKVWMMPSDGDEDTDSRISQFVVDTDSIPQFWRLKPFLTKLQLLRACEDGKILCLVHGFYFVLYDPETGSIEKLIQAEGAITRKIMNETLRGRNKYPLFNLHIDTLNFDSLQNIFTQDITVDS